MHCDATGHGNWRRTKQGKIVVQSEVQKKITEAGGSTEPEHHSVKTKTQITEVEAQQEQAPDLVDGGENKLQQQELQSEQ